MADIKISELTALASTAVDVAADVFAVVDTSATQTKKISVTNVLAPIVIDKASAIITNLGTVTTADINGGTWLGTIDGAWTAAGVTCANLGTVSAATSITSTAFVGPLTGTASIATTVTVADESSDTTCFPLFATAATGNLPPKSGSNLTFNSSTGLLTATLLAGGFDGIVGGNTPAAGTFTTMTASSNITMGDDTSIGISDSDERIEFDVDGDISVLGANFGIGTTTPKAKLQIGTRGVYSDISDETKISNNMYHDGSGWKAMVGNDECAMFTLSAGGVFNWESGTTNTASPPVASFTQKMILTAAGKLGIGTTNPGSTLTIRDDSVDVLRLDGSSVAHGMLTLGSTETYGRFGELAAGAGGL